MNKALEEDNHDIEDIVEEEEVLEEEDLEEELDEEASDEDTEDEEESEEDDLTIEQKARLMGWIPKEDYRKPPKTWVDAKEFVRRGQEELPVIRDTVRRMTKSLADKEKEITELTSTFDAALEFMEKQHNKKLKAIEQQKIEAVELGDSEAYKALTQEEKELLDDAPKFKKAEKPKQEGTLTEDERATMDAWAAKNQWFKSDKDLTVEMTAMFGVVEQTNPDLTLPEILAEAKKRVIRLHPDKFGNPKRNIPGGAENGGGKRPAPKGARNYASLPPDAKAICDQLVKRGTITKEEYVKDYYEGE